MHKYLNCNFFSYKESEFLRLTGPSVRDGRGEGPRGRRKMEKVEGVERAQARGPPRHRVVVGINCLIEIRSR